MLEEVVDSIFALVLNSPEPNHSVRRRRIAGTAEVARGALFQVARSPGRLCLNRRLLRENELAQRVAVRTDQLCVILYGARAGRAAARVAAAADTAEDCPVCMADCAWHLLNVLRRGGCPAHLDDNVLLAGEGNRRRSHLVLFCCCLRKSGGGLDHTR